jgi:hypothetical protein
MYARKSFCLPQNLTSTTSSLSIHTECGVYNMQGEMERKKASIHDSVVLECYTEILK